MGVWWVMSSDLIELECEYCGNVGTYPDVIEIRTSYKGHRTFACVDTAACDARDALASESDNEECEPSA